MSEGDEASEIRTLLGQRADVLAVLVEGQYDKSTLTDELGVSRSTIDRTVRRLETSGLVHRDGCGVEATRAGRLAYDAYRQYCEDTERIGRFSDLLAELPPSVTIDHALLDGATAYRSKPPAMGRPSNEVVALFREGTRVRGIAKVVNDTNAMEVFFRMVTEQGGRGTLVYTTDLADLLREEYFQMTHVLASTGRFRAYETETIPYELFIVNSEDRTRVAVLVYNSDEILRGLLVNDTDTAVAWAEETFGRYRDAATEITDEFLF